MGTQIQQNDVSETKKRNIVNNYIECLTKKYFDFHGRADRYEFWAFFLANLIIGFIMGLTKLLGFDILIFLYNLFTVIPMLAVCFRRLHDINKSGWWAGGYIITLGAFLIYQSIALMGIFFIVGLFFFILTARKSYESDNKWGKFVYDEKRDVIGKRIMISFILLLVMPILTIMILASAITTGAKIISEYNDDEYNEFMSGFYNEYDVAMQDLLIKSIDITKDKMKKIYKTNGNYLGVNLNKEQAKGKMFILIGYRPLGEYNVIGEDQTFTINMSKISEKMCEQLANNEYVKENLIKMLVNRQPYENCSKCSSSNGCSISLTYK